ncbi:Alpha-mannosidase 2 [Halotydeus destructor]|nr:Alpha-mannosidase 2 [Halotydeus destructor]
MSRTRLLFTSFLWLCIISFFYTFFLSIRNVDQEGGSRQVYKDVSYKLSHLESGLRANRKTLNRVHQRIGQLTQSVHLKPNLSRGEDDRCLESSSTVAKADIDVSRIYDEISFDNIDGGTWKQGWNIELNYSRLKNNKLKVIVVPHSHNDPGWTKTFEQYFEDQTVHILDNLITKMSANPAMKFIWAETSYLDLWWQSLKSEDDKNIFRRLIKTGQLEIVTGGWVMNDEANCHYSAIINQLVEGHEWIRINLGDQIKPKNSWSIDPFGLSPTMAFILKKMGFESMLIQRVHYSIKKYLAKNQFLEFQWRQQFEVAPVNDILCHMMPFYLYDISHTCGPDPKASFGTLADYFNSVKSYDFPTLTGDFFTYADRDDHYWSGYFTSRPFHKRYDRVLEAYVRGAEILFSAMAILNGTSDIMSEAYGHLDYARKNLGLFQHHDAIAGTARDTVVNDYSQRMFASLINSQRIIGYATATLFNFASNSPLEAKDNLLFRDAYENQDSLAAPWGIELKKNQRWSLIIYNSLASNTKELICFYIRTKVRDWSLSDESDKQIDVQINPVWSAEKLIAEWREACFMTELSALSLTRFIIKADLNASKPTKGLVTVFNYAKDIFQEFEHISEGEDGLQVHELESPNLKLVFSAKDGMLQRVMQYEGGIQFGVHEVRTQFMAFGTKSGKGKVKSGAYLFMPDTSEAKPLKYSEPVIRVTRGSLVSRLEVVLRQPLAMTHQVTLVHGEKHFKIENTFHLAKGALSNKELLMRFDTDIRNNNTFYTDLNGFQMTKRKRYAKIPVQGNVYPVPTLLYIEDTSVRLNIISGQPLGGSSLKAGSVDIFMDRKLLKDDSLGLGQGVTDNRKTTEVFKVLFEQKPREELKPTLAVNRESQKLLYPPFVMMTSRELNQINQRKLSLLAEQLPCDVHLLNLRSRESLTQFHLTLHRMAIGCDSICNNGGDPVRLDQLFLPDVVAELDPEIAQTSLSYMHNLKNITIHSDVYIEDNDFVVLALKAKN